MIKTISYWLILYFLVSASSHAATLTGNENNIVVNIFPSAERGGLGDRVSNLYMAHKIANTYKNVTVNYLLFKDNFQADFERLDEAYWQQNKKIIEGKNNPEQFIELTYQLGEKPFNILVVPHNSNTLSQTEEPDLDDLSNYDFSSKNITPADIFFNNLKKNKLDIKKNVYTYNVTFSTARHEGFFAQADRNLMFERMNVNHITLTKFSEYNMEVPHKDYSVHADDGYFPDYRLYISSQTPQKLPKSNLISRYGKKCQEIGFSYTKENEPEFFDYDDEVLQSENYAKAMYDFSQLKESFRVCAFIHSKKTWTQQTLESFFDTNSIEIIHDYTQSENYLVAQINEKFLVVFWQALPLKENISLIAYSTLPVFVTGDMSLTLALEYRKPFIYQTLFHKSHDSRSIADKALRRFQTLSGIEMRLPTVGVDEDADYRKVYSTLLNIKENYSSLQKILFLGLQHIQTMPENLFTLIRIKNSLNPENFDLAVLEKSYTRTKNPYIQIPYPSLSRSISNLISLLNFMSQSRPTIFDNNVKVNFLNDISDIGIDLIELSGKHDRQAREEIHERIADLRRRMIETEPSDWKLYFHKTIETPYKKQGTTKNSKIYNLSQGNFVQAFQTIINYRSLRKLTFTQATQCLQRLKEIDLAIYEGTLIEYKQAYDKLTGDIEEASCS